MNKTSSVDRYSDEVEINFLNILFSIIEKKTIVILLTAFTSIVGLVYALNTPKLYNPEVEFKSPGSESSILINDSKVYSVTNDIFFSNFLSLLSSKNFQKQVFLDEGYLNKFIETEQTPDNIDVYLSRTLEQIQLSEPLDNGYYETFYILSFVSSSPHSSDFLNTLVLKASEETSSNIIDNLNLLLDIEIKSLKASLNELEFEHKTSREIKLNNLVNDIDMAKKMKIFENNFIDQSNENISVHNFIDQSNENILVSNQSTPRWFLYGSKALENILLNFDKYFDDDHTFDIKKNQLENEILRLETFKQIKPSEIPSITLTKSAVLIEVQSNKKLIVFLYFLFGFFSSCLFVLARKAYLSRI